MGKNDYDRRDLVALSAEKDKLTAQIQLCDAGSVEGLMLKKQKLQLELQLAEACENDHAKEVQDEALESGMVLHVKQPTVVAGKECPICYSAFPNHVENWDDEEPFTFYACCGNFICRSCTIQNFEVNGVNTQSLHACPFCREPGIWPMQNAKHLPASAARGISHAQILMAKDLLSMGNEEDAMQWCQRAAEQGSLEAEELLGVFHLDDFRRRGLGESDKKAVAYFAKCARHGYACSQDAMGYHHFRVLCDPETAVKWYVLAAAQGFDDAMFSLSEMYYSNHFRGLKHPAPFVLYWAKKAALRGHIQAQHFYAENLLNVAMQTFGDEYYLSPGINVMPEVLYWERQCIAAGGCDRANVDAQSKAAKFVDWFETTQLKRACSYCRKPPQAEDQRLKSCTRCKAVAYCGKECQREHWKLGHKVDCFTPPLQQQPNRSRTSS